LIVRKSFFIMGRDRVGSELGSTGKPGGKEDKEHQGVPPVMIV